MRQSGSSVYNLLETFCQESNYFSSLVIDRGQRELVARTRISHKSACISHGTLTISTLRIDVRTCTYSTGYNLSLVTGGFGRCHL